MVDVVAMGQGSVVASVAVEQSLVVGFERRQVGTWGTDERSDLVCGNPDSSQDKAVMEVDHHGRQTKEA